MVSEKTSGLMMVVLAIVLAILIFVLPGYIYWIILDSSSNIINLWSISIPKQRLILSQIKNISTFSFF